MTCLTPGGLQGEQFFWHFLPIGLLSKHPIMIFLMALDVEFWGIFKLKIFFYFYLISRFKTWFGESIFKFNVDVLDFKIEL